MSYFLRNSSVVFSEKQSQFPILLIDKKGIVSAPLASVLQTEFVVTCVSSFFYTQTTSNQKNFVPLYWKRKLPKIPDVFFQHILFFLHEENEIKNILPHIIKKAKKEGSRVTLFVYWKDISEKLTSFFLKQKGISVIVYGDLLGEYASSFPNGCASLLSQAAMKKRMSLAKDGMLPCYPCSWNDFLRTVITVIFSEKYSEGLYYCMPKNPVTEFHFASEIHKLYPDIVIDFIAQKHGEKKEHFLHKGMYLWEEKPLSDIIRALDLSWYKNQQNGVVDAYKEEKGYGKTILWMVSSALIIIIAPILITAFCVWGGYGALGLGVVFFEQHKQESMMQMFRVAKYTFTAGQYTNELVRIQRAFLDGKESGFSQSLSVGKTLIDMAESVEKIQEGLSTLYRGESKDSYMQLQTVLQEIKYISLSKEQLVTSLDYIQTHMPVDKQKITSVKKELEEIDRFLSKTIPTFDLIPEILGFSGEKKYLLLFQNNMELRPGGGFIGSYGIVRVKNGQFGAVEVFDVYDADGKLKGHIEPPFAIRRHLPSVHLFLRDSNFSFDFVENAKTGARFLKEETGEVVDGVIGIDVSFLELWLAHIGEIELTEYKQQVNSKNVYELTQTHAEKGFFPGSTQKKDFIRTLFKALEKKTKEEKAVQIGLGKAIVEAIQRKHMMVAFSKKEIQDIFTIQGLSASMWDARPFKENQVRDSLSISEANIGINKVNAFVKREVEYAVDISDKKLLKSKVTITYTNSSKKNNWLGGEYKNYLRIAVPLGAQLEKVMIDGISQSLIPAQTDFLVYESKGFIPERGLEIETYDDATHRVFGFLTKIPVSAQQKIIIIYTRPLLVSFEKPVQYSLFFVKQPGTREYPFVTSLTIPELMNTVEKPAEVVRSGTLFTQIAEIRNDFIWEISLAPR